MHTTRYQRFLFSLRCCSLLLMLAACSPTSNSTPTPTVGEGTVTPGTSTAVVTTTPVPPTQTDCPADGTARAAVMPALTLGSHQNIVYLVNTLQSGTPSSATLKRYDVATGNKIAILNVSNASITQAQVSADGQWILFVAMAASQLKLQLVRIDGQGLQTLYCSKPPANGANPPVALNHVQWSSNERFIIFHHYTPTAAFIYLLNTADGKLQPEVSVTNFEIGAPLTWLDTTRFYLLGPEIDGPPTALYLVDTSQGPNQTTQQLQQIFDARGVWFCWDVDSSYDGKHLFNSQCATDPSKQGPGIDAQHGPSTINVRPITGGLPKSVFTTTTMAIVMLRLISKTTLLFIVNNNSINESSDTSRNGLWKINTDGTGLLRLAIVGAGVSGVGYVNLCPFTQDSWSNVSRDGKMYALQINHTGGTAPQKPVDLVFGSLSSSEQPTIFESNSDAGKQLAVVGWTTV